VNAHKGALASPNLRRFLLSTKAGLLRCTQMKSRIGRMKLLQFSFLSGNKLRCAVPLAAAVVLSACVTPPPRTYAVPAPPPQRVYVYPANGQTAEQTDRDRYECHVWAVQQTGVDPSRADASPYERVVVQPANPPGSGTAHT
jgi:hypothetical protein